MMEKSLGMRGKWIWCALSAIALVAAACGGSSKSSAGSSSTGKATGSAGAASGSPIKIMLAGAISSESFSAGETVSGAQAAAAPINAAGGLNGHKIQIISCNDQFLPNVAATCGREAVSDHVSAVIEVETDYAPEMLQYLQPAGIPLLGNLPGNPPELMDNNVFTLGGGPYAEFSALGTALVQEGHCQRTAIIVLAFAADELSGRNIRYAIEQAGGKVTTLQAVSPTLPSYASFVASAIGAGADCITDVLAPAQVTSLLQAMKSSSKPDLLYGGAAGDITPQGFDALRNQLNGDIFVSTQYLVPSSQSSGQPAGAVSAFESAMKSYEPSAQVDPESLSGYEGMTLFIDAAHKASNYDAPTMLSALSKLHNVQLSGLPVPISYDTPNPNAKMARVTEPYVVVYKMQNGLYNLDTKVNAANALGKFLSQPSP